MALVYSRTFSVEGEGPELDGLWTVRNANGGPLPPRSRFAPPFRTTPAIGRENVLELGDPRTVREVLTQQATWWTPEARAFLEAALGDDPRAGQVGDGARVRDAWLWATLPGHVHPTFDASVETARKRFWAELAGQGSDRGTWPRDLWLGQRDERGIPFHPPVGWHSPWRPDAAVERRFNEAKQWAEQAARHASRVEAGVIPADTPNPWDTALDPASTVRVAFPGQLRTRWIVQQALGAGIEALHTWDVHEVLVRGVQARPNGSLLAMIHAAYPDGVFHGMEAIPLSEAIRGVGRGRLPTRLRAPSSVIKELFRSAMKHWPLTDATTTVVLTTALLCYIHEWRTGQLHDFTEAGVRDRIVRLRQLIWNAEDWAVSGGR